MSSKNLIQAACVLLLIELALGCVNVTERAERTAERGGLSPDVIQGTPFRHQAFMRKMASADLFVFIEGDGLPWTHGGTEIARDPTPRRPLALELAIHTPHSILYLGRPCYFSMASDPGCSPVLWTSARYSDRVVASMAAAVNGYAATNGYRRAVLIGYSGGGTLAVLMAPRIPITRAVITIAANLDVAAWSRWHGYLPLDQSLNPATQPALAAEIIQLHLVAGRDANVPEMLDRGYFDSLKPGQIWHFPQFDHVCCWVEQWPQILGKIGAAISD
jgi:pimeloyl-ACP methyl ester carboxylesterase